MMTIRTARPRMGGGRRSRRDANAIGRAREGVVTTRASRMREIKYVSSDAVEVENARGVSRAVGACARRWVRSVYPNGASSRRGGRARGARRAA